MFFASLGLKTADIAGFSNVFVKWFFVWIIKDVLIWIHPRQLDGLISKFIFASYFNSSGVSAFLNPVTIIWFLSGIKPALLQQSVAPVFFAGKDAQELYTSKSWMLALPCGLFSISLTMP